MLTPVVGPVGFVMLSMPSAFWISRTPDPGALPIVIVLPLEVTVVPLSPWSVMLPLRPLSDRTTRPKPAISPLLDLSRVATSVTWIATSSWSPPRLRTTCSSAIFLERIELSGTPRAMML